MPDGVKFCQIVCLSSAKICITKTNKTAAKTKAVIAGTKFPKPCPFLNTISQKYKFEAIEREPTSPAQYYKDSDGYIFGVIEPYKDDFCKTCNRIRLTAEGHLIPCLYFDEALSITEAGNSSSFIRKVHSFKSYAEFLSLTS